MLKGLGDLGNIMKLQKEIKGIQKRLKRMETEGRSSDGAVTAVVNGDFRLVSIHLDSEFVKNADHEQLEQSIVTAVNDAVTRNKEFAAQEMQKLTGGLNIPGLADFLE